MDSARAKKDARYLEQFCEPAFPTKIKSSIMCETERTPSLFWRIH